MPWNHCTNFATNLPSSSCPCANAGKRALSALLLLLSVPFPALEVRTDFYSSFEPETIHYEYTLEQIKKRDRKLKSPNPSQSGLNASTLKQKITRALSWEVLSKEQTISAVLYGEELVEGGVRQSYFLEDPLIGVFQVLVLRPLLGRFRNAAILALHGHGGNPYGFSQRKLVRQLLKKGFVVGIPGFRAMEGLRQRFDPGQISTEGKLVFYQGPRIREPSERSIARELNELGQPLMGLRVREAALSLKLLQSILELNSSRIALLGHSGGSAVANLLLRLETGLAGTVLDYQSPYSRSFETFCCEGIPSLSPFAAQIHQTQALPFPVLKVPYNFPDKRLVLSFLQNQLPGETAGQSTPSHIKIIRQKIASWNPQNYKSRRSLENFLSQVRALPYAALRDSAYSDLLNRSPVKGNSEYSMMLAMLHDLPKKKNQALLKICLRQSLATEKEVCSRSSKELALDLSRIQSTRWRQEVGVRSALTLISNDLTSHGLKILTSLKPWDYDSLTPKTTQDLRQIFSLLLLYHSLDQARVIEEFLPPFELAKTWLPIALGSAGSKYAEDAFQEITRILKSQEIHSSLRKAFQCQLSRKSIEKPPEPCSSLSQELKRDSSLNIEQALIIASTLSIQDLSLEVQSLLNGLANPYDRVEFLLLMALENLPPGPQKDHCLSHLPTALKELSPPSHRLNYLQLLINLLPVSQRDLWFKLALSSLEEITDQDLQSSRAEPILNLALEGTNFSQALKLSEFLKSPPERDLQKQIIQRKIHSKSLGNPAKEVIEKSFTALKNSNDSPLNLQQYLDLEKRASKAGLKTIRLTILKNLFKRWKETGGGNRVSEALNIDFAERLLDINLRDHANEVAKDLSVEGYLKVQVLGLSQVHPSQRRKRIGGLLDALSRLDPSIFILEMLEEILRRIESTDFGPMRARISTQAFKSIPKVREEEFLERLLPFALEIAAKGAVYELGLTLEKIEGFLKRHPDQRTEILTKTIAQLRSEVEIKSGIPLKEGWK